MHDEEKTETCTELSLKLKYDIMIIILYILNGLFLFCLNATQGIAQFLDLAKLHVM